MHDQINTEQAKCNQITDAETLNKFTKIHPTGVMFGQQQYDLNSSLTNTHKIFQQHWHESISTNNIQ